MPEHGDPKVARQIPVWAEDSAPLQRERNPRPQRPSVMKIQPSNPAGLDYPEF